MSFTLPGKVMNPLSGWKPILTNLHYSRLGALLTLLVACTSPATEELQSASLVITNGTIMPGIFNAHAHKVSAVATRRILFLFYGVTPVCDLGSLLKLRFCQDSALIL